MEFKTGDIVEHDNGKRYAIVSIDPFNGMGSDWLRRARVRRLYDDGRGLDTREVSVSLSKLHRPR